MVSIILPLALTSTGYNSLSIETGRFYNIERNMRICNVCYENIIEDEYHFYFSL